MVRGFLDSSVGKESTCNAGDTGSIPGSGRSAGEEIGHPLQYPWTSLVAQLEKNPPAMRETWVWSLGWEDPLEKGKATHFSILENSMDCIVHGVAKSWTRLSNVHFHFQHGQTRLWAELLQLDVYYVTSDLRGEVGPSKRTNGNFTHSVGSMMKPFGIKKLTLPWFLLNCLCCIPWLHFLWYTTEE